MSSSRVTVDFVTPTRAPREKLYISVLTDLIVISLLEKEHISATAKLLTSYLTEKMTFGRHQGVFTMSSGCLVFSLFLRDFPFFLFLRVG